MVFLHAVEFIAEEVDCVFAQTLDRLGLISPAPLRTFPLAAGRALEHHRIERRVEQVAAVVRRNHRRQRSSRPSRSTLSSGRPVGHYGEYR